MLYLPVVHYDLGIKKVKKFDIKYQLSDCTLLGDKGYLSSQIQPNLFESANIRLETPKRSDEKEYKPPLKTYRKSRKRIETLFSQMCDQFMIRG